MKSTRRAEVVDSGGGNMSAEGESTAERPVLPYAAVAEGFPIIQHIYVNSVSKYSIPCVLLRARAACVPGST